MKTVKLALTEKRKMNCDAYIFPEEYFDIPGVEEFSDLDAVVQHAAEALEPYENQDVELYVNGGLTSEVLAVIQAAADKNIKVRIMHYDRDRQEYRPQQVVWTKKKHREISKSVVLNLCEGRHIMPGESIFGRIPSEKIMDFSWQEKFAEEYLSTYEDTELRIYLSGLSQLAVSTLNAAGALGLPVVFFHYNYDTEDYFPQNMQ